MQHQQKINVVGIGPKGECLKHEVIEKAEILAGGKRLLDFFPEVKAEKIVLDKNIREKLLKLKNSNSKIVILASGDPLFFGIGKLLIEIFGKDNLEFIPYLNSVQLLCSKAKVNYEDFINVSIHGRKIDETTIGKIKFNKKIAILTDKKNNINILAENLLKYLPENSKVILGQLVGTEKERILFTNIKNLLNITPSELDTVLIFNDNVFNFKFGLHENNYFHEKGLITKKEIRAITLSYLELNKDSILWDIGAGSGSISVEASSLCYSGKIYSIEKNNERINMIKKNIQKFKCHNVNVIEGVAPEVLKNIEKADRVFIGGAHNLDELLSFLKQKIKGIVVANFVLIEKLYKFIEFCTKNNIKFEVSSIQASNLKNIKGGYYFKSQNLIYIAKLILR